MAYSAITDIVKYIESAQLVELCTLVAGKTTTDAEVTGPVTEAIESADAEIDLYCLGRYSGLRSVSPVPPIVNFMSCILTLNILYGRRGKHPAEWVAANYEKITNQESGILYKISRGWLTLPADSAGAVQAETAQYLTDALDNDDNLNDADRRNMTLARLYNLTGVSHRQEDE